MHFLVHMQNLALLSQNA